MRKFINKTIFFSLGLFFIFLALFFGRSSLIHLVDWELQKDKHVIFMGASHIQEGINPMFYDGALNIASRSERYMFTYLKLEKLLEVNQQIDTVFLQFAPTDIHRNADTKYFQKNEMLHFLPLYTPFFSSKEWSYYLKEAIKTKNSKVLEVLFNKQFSEIPKTINDYGSFNSYVREFDRNKKAYDMPDWLNKGSSINFHYFNKIVRLCREADIKLILIYMPMFNKDQFYNTDYFYKQYRAHFNTIQFVDYSDWICPDSLRKDEHHLNKKGAKIFTQQLSDYFSIKAPKTPIGYKKIE